VFTLALRANANRRHALLWVSFVRAVLGAGSNCDDFLAGPEDCDLTLTVNRYAVRVLASTFECHFESNPETLSNTIL
jgi:hypothetical protein